MVTCDALYFFLIPSAEIIICIPVINSVMETLRANGLSPKLGTIIAKADTAIFSVPTITRIPFDQPEISLLLIPCIILLKPLNSKANAPSAIGDTGWDNGMDMSTMAMDIISGPSPIMTILSGFPGNCSAIPITILSIPITMRTMEISRTVIFIVMPGYVRVAIVKIMAIVPKPISINRNQSRNFLLLILSELEEYPVVKHHSPYR